MGSLGDFIARIYTINPIGEPELTEEYDPNNFNYKDVIDFLNHQNFKFTWETTLEHSITDDLSVIEVNVYVPSNILHGRAYYHTNNEEALHAHKMAIEDAIKYLKVKGNTETKAPQKVEEKATPVNNSNSILDDLINNNQIKETSSNVSENKEEIPFFTPEELAAKSKNSGSKNYSQEQIAHMKALKEKGYDLDKMVNSWKPEFKSSYELTTDNINDFFEWVEKLEKSQC